MSLKALRFRRAVALMPETVAAVTGQLRIRVLRWFPRSALIGRDDVREMLAWEESGFNLDAAARGHSMSSLLSSAADNSRMGDVSSWPTTTFQDGKTKRPRLTADGAEQSPTPATRPTAKRAMRTPASAYATDHSMHEAVGLARTFVSKELRIANITVPNPSNKCFKSDKHLRNSKGVKRVTRHQRHNSILYYVSAVFRLHKESPTAGFI